MKCAFTGTKVWMIDILTKQHGEFTLNIDTEESIVVNTNCENRKIQTLLYITNLITLSKCV